MAVLLHPAMPSAGRPDWPGARWIGDLDLDVLREREELELADSDGYAMARLLVRRAGSVLGFIDVPVDAGLVHPDVLDRALEDVSRKDPDAVPVGTSEEGLAPPRITVIVCTRDRADHLRGSLRAILALDYPSFDVVVVDNASRTSETRDLLRDEFDDERITFVEEPRAGLARARNTGLLRSTGEIVAYTDDDVQVDRHWLTALVVGFRSEPGVVCVAGLVPSGELRTRVQGYFDDRVSWSKNLQRRAYSLASPPSDSPLFPFSVGDYGTGANFALTRDAALRLGGFDTAFGVGTPTGGGEDIDMFTRVVLAGHTLVVEPSAIVWHRHRADLDALRVQARGYGVGLGAWLAKVMSTPSTARMAIARSPRAVARLVGLVRGGDSDAAQHPAAVESPPAEDPAWAGEVAAVRRLEFLSVLRGPVRLARQRLAGEGLLPPVLRSGALRREAPDASGAVGVGASELACIVLAHADPAQVRRLVHALDPFPVFLHVDARTTDEVFDAMTSDLPPRCTVLPRIKTGWATWGAVRAELEGYRAALHATGASHLALLSGADYPLASSHEIQELLDGHRSQSFFEARPLPVRQWGRSGGFSRLEYRHWAFGKRMLRLPIKRRLPADIAFAGGSSNKILARQHAEVVVRVADEHPELVRFWRRTWSADETFVPSILNSPRFAPQYAAENVPENVWWIDWPEKRQKSPPFVTDVHRERLLQRRVWPTQERPSLFARKFSSAQSSEVLDDLDRARNAAEGPDARQGVSEA